MDNATLFDVKVSYPNGVHSEYNLPLVIYFASKKLTMARTK
jgi:hypothetical protein